MTMQILNQDEYNRFLGQQLTAWANAYAAKAEMGEKFSQWAKNQNSPKQPKTVKPETPKPETKTAQKVTRKRPKPEAPKMSAKVFLANR